MVLERTFGLVPRKKALENILNKSFFLAKGTFRDVADYDDAWLLALAHEARMFMMLAAILAKPAFCYFCPARLRTLCWSILTLQH